MPIVLIVAGSLLTLLVLAEVYARVALGLGNPPLYMADPRIEYLALPSRTYQRFGNRVSYNAHSMRSRDFPAHKSDPAELRVLVVGDSIVNGGAQTDQDALATSLLEGELSDALDRLVIVANIAADSWGPPNVLAYLERFGLFDADVLVIVLNSEDYADAPTFEPLDDRRPRHRPLLALQETATHWVRRSLRRRRNRTRQAQPLSAEAIEACMGALRELIGLGRAAGASVLLAQHLSQSELENGPEAGHHEIARLAGEMDLTPIPLGAAFAESLREGRDPYRDRYHLNEQGQRVIARTLRDPILEVLSSRIA